MRSHTVFGSVGVVCHEIGVPRLRNALFLSKCTYVRMYTIHSLQTRMRNY